MTSPPSAKGIHHDRSQPHSRRNSGRMSFSPSLPRSGSAVNSPRTACPPDGDAFSYDPTHLPAWYLPQTIWDRLPAEIHTTIAAVQHAGAAVLTGFDRLDKHNAVTNSNQTDHSRSIDESRVCLEDLPPRKLRTASNASSFYLSDAPSPLASGSPSSQSRCASPYTTSGMPDTVPPVSPMCLGPPELTDRYTRSRERSFSTPLEPHDAYYAMELSHLRTEALPRLRHMCHKVDTEWIEAKRSGKLQVDVAEDFENWWTEKKCNVLGLNERGKRLATNLGLANSGMGWSVS